MELEPRVGDRYLLCSDGVTDLVSDERIAEVLLIADPHSAAARLVEDALLAGGTDNATCLVFDVIDGPQVTGDGMLIGAVIDVGNVVDAAAVRHRLSAHVTPHHWYSRATSVTMMCRTTHV